MGTIKFYLFILVSLSMLSTAAAQTLSLQSIPDNKKHFGLSFNRPFFSNDNKFSALSGVFQLHVSIPVSSSLSIISDIPIVNVNDERRFQFFPQDSRKYEKTELGNIFIGLQTRPKTESNQKSIVSFGVALPTGGEETGAYGILSDYYGFLKYAPNSLGIYFNYAFHKIYEEGFNYGLEAGPSILISTKSEGSSRSNLYLHYGVSAGYKVQQLLFNAEFFGVMLVSEDFENFSDRFINLADFGVQWMGETITPKVYYKIYLRDDLSDLIDGVLGLGVSVAIDSI